MSDPSVCEAASIEAALSLFQVGEERFLCRDLSPNMDDRIFGGQLIGDALMAAQHTVPEHKPPSAMSLWFHRPGSLTAPLEISVERTRDGRAFAHRRVMILQSQRLLATAEVSFHEGSHGPQQQWIDAPRVPEPETLPELAELAERYAERIDAATRSRMLKRKSMLARPTDSEAGLVHPTMEAMLSVWLKSTNPLPQQAAFRYGAAAYFSDYWLPAPTRSALVSNLYGSTAPMISLNHSLWFHHEPPVEDYLLYVTRSPKTEGGRGLSLGSLFDRRGRLCMSSAQDVLLP